MLRADLHLHSSSSGRHGCSGGARGPVLPDPETIDAAARTRGMDIVTLTDTDTIDGCRRYLDRHPAAKHFFMSEEVRAREPWRGAEVRVLLYGIDEAAHAEAQRLKGDVRDLLGWARQAGVAAALGPSPGLIRPDGRPEPLRDLIPLFERYEIRNPAWGRSWGSLVARLAQEADPERTFGVTAGSGAASVEGVGLTWTVALAADACGFVDELRAGRTWAEGRAPGVVDFSAVILRSLPLRRAAAPLLEHYVRRTRLGVRIRRARHHLDQSVVREFQERTRTYGADGAHRPAAGMEDVFGFDR